MNLSVRLKELDSVGRVPAHQMTLGPCDGILEKIFVPPWQFKEYIWIPHRPVLKSDPTSTTKIRLVFNCSLKTSESPSLYEAAYQRVNLTNDLLDLLLSL